jgi:hypothetical protein
MRTIILHYHLFKNAGTSLDAAFKENFSEEKGEWVTKEFPAQPALNREQVKQWIIDNPQAKCFSSHTALLPTPKIDGVIVLPVIFLRHPIDRIASAYAFEKKQVGDGFGAVLARNTDFNGYVETRLVISNDRQCRNFHIQRLSTMFGEKQGDEFTRAKMAINKLPFVGIVENFSSSLKELEQWLNKEGFQDLKLAPSEKNVSRSIEVPLSEKLNKIEKNLQENVWTKLLEANKGDIELYTQESDKKC